MKMPKFATSTKSYFYKHSLPSVSLNLKGSHTFQDSSTLDQYIQNLKSQSCNSNTEDHFARGNATLVDVFDRFKAALKSSKFQLMDILSEYIDNKKGNITSI